MFSMFKRFIESWRNKRRFKKRLAEMRKRDPFIYR